MDNQNHLHEFFAAIASGEGIDSHLDILLSAYLESAYSEGLSKAQISEAKASFLQAMAQALAQGMSPEAAYQQALDTFHASVNASLNVIADPEQTLLQAITSKNADEKINQTIDDLLPASVEASTEAKQAFIEQLEQSLVSGVSPADALALAQKQAAILSAVNQALESTENGVAASLLKALVTGEGIEQAISEIAGEGNQTENLENALSQALSEGLSPDAATAVAQAIADKIAVADANAQANAANNIAAALASGENVNDAIAEIMPQSVAAKGATAATQETASEMTAMQETAGDNRGQGANSTINDAGAVPGGEANSENAENTLSPNKTANTAPGATSGESSGALNQNIDAAIGDTDSSLTAKAVGGTNNLSVANALSQNAATNASPSATNTQTHAGGNLSQASSLASVGDVKTNTTANDVANSENFEQALSQNLASGMPLDAATAVAAATAVKVNQVQASSEANAGNSLAAALASGRSLDQAIQAIGGDVGSDALEAALSSSLASGASPSAAVAQAQAIVAQIKAAQVAAANSAGNSLASALASGQDVTQAIQALGGGAESFEGALAQSLATGISPDAALVQAQVVAEQLNAAQTAAAGNALASALASGQNVAQVISDVGGAGAENFESALSQQLASGASIGAAVNQAQAVASQLSAIEANIATNSHNSGDPAIAQLASAQSVVSVDTSPESNNAAQQGSETSSSPSLVSETVPSSAVASSNNATTSNQGSQSSASVTNQNTQQSTASGGEATNLAGEVNSPTQVNSTSTHSLSVGDRAASVDTAATVASTATDNPFVSSPMEYDSFATPLTAIGGQNLGATGISQTGSTTNDNVLGTTAETASSTTQPSVTSDAETASNSSSNESVSEAMVSESTNPFVFNPFGPSAIGQIDLGLAGIEQAGIGLPTNPNSNTNPPPPAGNIADVEATADEASAPINRAPINPGGTFTTDEDNAFTGNLNTLATDPEGSPLTFVLLTQPSHGGIQLNPNGTFTYTPNASYNGTDQITFSASDPQGLTTNATVNFTVNAVNDAPEITSAAQSGTITETPDVIDGTDTEPANATGIISFNDVDLINNLNANLLDTPRASVTAFTVTSSTLTLNASQTNALENAFSLDDAALSNASNTTGAGSTGWTYSISNHDIDFLGADDTIELNFEVTVDDNNGGTASQKVAITIQGTNDAPIITDGPDTAALTETNAALSSTGTLTITDVDTTDLVTASVDSFTVSGTSNRSDAAAPTDAQLQAMLSVVPTAILDGSTNTATLAWNFDSGTEAFDYLATGETLILEYTIKVEDDNATPLSDTETVTITVSGTSDAPVITSNGGAATASISISENTTAVTTLTVTDAETGTPAVLSTNFDEGNLASHIHFDVPNSSIADITLDMGNDELDFSAAGGTDMWANRQNAPIAWTASPELQLGQTWSVETHLELATLNAGQQAGITFYSDADGSKPEITFGLHNWVVGVTPTVILEGVGTNDPNVEVAFAGQALYLKVDVTENGAADTYNFYYKATETDSWSQLGGDALNFTRNIANDRVGLFYKTNAAKDGVSFDYLNVIAPSTITYSITGGADQTLFDINASTGELSFTTAADFENHIDADADGIYNVTVQATDGTEADTQEIAITIDDVNEAPSAVTLTAVQNSIDENTDTSSGIHVANINVTDDALGTNNLAVTGADAADFEIRNGNELFFIGSSPDFESKTSYDVAVTVDDTTVGSTPDLTSSTFTLTVDDVNEAPTAVNLTAVQSNIDENTNTSSGIHVANIAVTDDALGTNNLAVTGTDAADFEIRNGNELFFIGSSPDYETKTSYDVAVTVNDTTVGSTPDLTSSTFTLTVDDVNEAPTAVNLTAVQSNIDENTDTSSGIHVANIAVTDDALGTNALSLTGADAADFEIRNGNELFFIGSSPDYETKASYDVAVTVDDTTVGSTPDLTSSTFTLTVDDVNEVPTAVNLIAVQSSIDENTNTSSGIHVANINVTDDALGTNNLAVTGADAADFEIRNGNELFFIGSSPDYETKTSYDVAVTADDTTVGSTPDLTSSTFTLTVDDVNEAPTAVTLAAVQNSIDENTDTSTGIHVADIAVTDDGLGTNTLALTGADSGDFEIRNDTELYFIGSSLDYETKTNYEVAVTADDTTVGSTPDASSATFTLDVNNVNETSITSNGAGATATISIAENTTAVTSMTTTAAPSVLAANFDGNALESHIHLDTPNTSVANITLDTLDNELNFSSSANTLVWNNRSDAPIAWAANPNVAIGDTWSVETHLELATLNDGQKAGITFYGDVDGGVPDINFVLNNWTGSPTVALQGIGDNVPNESITLASDQSNLYLKTDITENGTSDIYNFYYKAVATDPWTQLTGDALNFTSDMANDRVGMLYTTKAAKAGVSFDYLNIIAPSTITYSITGGADQALFDINASTGALSFKTAADFENHTDADGDGIYDVTVQAANGTETDTQQIAVTVTDVNEAPSAVTLTTVQSNIDENVDTSAGIHVANIAVTDDGSGTNTLGLTGTDAAEFEIRNDTELYFIGSSPDYETKTNYEVAVTADDTTVGSTPDATSATFTLDVNNVNETSITSNGASATAAISIAENTTAVTSMTATAAPTVLTAYFSENTLDSHISLDIINSSIADISLDTANDELDFSSSGDTNMWTSRKNVPIAWAANPDATLGQTWSVETHVEFATLSDGQVAGITFYDDIDGSVPDTVFVLNNWHTAPYVLLSGLGDGDPYAKVDLVGNQSSLYLKVDVTENGASDIYNFFYKATENDVWSQLGGDALNYTSNMANDRVGFFYKTIGARDGASFDYFNITTPATVTYSIVGGADQNLFDIDANTGALSFKTAADFENHTDADGDGIYDVTVQAANGTETDTQQIAVTVTDVNEAPSAVTLTTVQSNIDENVDTSAGIHVANIAVTDDGSGTNTLGLTGTDAAEFEIRNGTELYFIGSSPDYETKTSYDVAVTADDTTVGSTPDATSATFTLGVNDVNEDVVITSNNAGTTAAISISENTTAITTVTATAVPSVLAANFDGNTLESHIYLDIPNASVANITLDTINDELDFSASANTDMWTTRHDAAIAWTANPNVAIGETWSVETYVELKTLNDGQVAGLTFYDDIDGSLPDISLVLRNWGGNPLLMFQGLGDNNPREDVQFGASQSNLYLKADVTENGTSDIYNFYYKTAAENDWSQVGGTAINYTSDMANARAGIYYKTNGAQPGASFDYLNITTPATVTYSIVGGADQNLFDIDASTGALSFKTAADFENHTDADGDGVYDVTVQASDGTETDTQQIAVTVTDVNEAPTAVTLTAVQNGIDENTDTSSGIHVANINVTDDLLGTNTRVLTGTNAAEFEIRNDTELYFIGSSPDYETKTSYDVAVTVDDTTQGSTPDATSATFTLNVNDIDEAPTINQASSGNQTLTLDGDGDAIRIADADILDPGTGDFTVEGWFYWGGSAPNNTEMLVSKNGRGSTNSGWAIEVLKTGELQMSVDDNGSANAANNNGAVHYDLSNTTVGWHHFAMTITSDGSTGVINGYLNGSSTNFVKGYSPTIYGNLAGQAGELEYDANGVATPKDLVIGAVHGGSKLWDYSSISMDEVRVWNTARTNQEITDNMNQSLNGNETGLVGLWKLDGNANDATSNGNHGTLVGDASFQNEFDFTVATSGTFRALLLGEDVDSHGLTYAIKTNPSKGTLTVDGAEFIYVNDGTTGSDSFEIDISDGTNTTTETVNILVGGSNTNAAPTAVTLTAVQSSIDENTDTSSGIHVANIAVTDDGLGTNTLALTGSDSGDFEIRNDTELFFIGSSPDYEYKTSYDVAVAADDTTVGSTPDASSATFTLNVADLADGSAPTISQIASGNQTLKLDGDGDAIQIPDANVFNPGTGSFTVEAWFYWDGNAPATDEMLVAKNGYTINKQGWAIQILDTGDLQMSMHNGASTSARAATHYDLLSNNTSVGWHHVAMVMTANGNTGTISGYLDSNNTNFALGHSGNSGDNNGELNYNNNGIEPAKDVLIGAVDSGSGGIIKYANRAIDEVRIWNTARTNQEITDNMNQSLNGNETGLVGLWKLDGNANDSTSNANNGTLLGDSSLQNEFDFSVATGGTFRALLLGEDTDSNALSYTVSTNPGKGSVSVEGAQFTYVNDGTTGTDSFEINISDGVNSTTETVNISISANGAIRTPAPFELPPTVEQSNAEVTVLTTTLPFGNGFNGTPAWSAAQISDDIMTVNHPADNTTEPTTTNPFGGAPIWSAAQISNDVSSSNVNMADEFAFADTSAVVYRELLLNEAVSSDSANNPATSDAAQETAITETEFVTPDDNNSNTPINDDVNIPIEALAV